MSEVAHPSPAQWQQEHSAAVEPEPLYMYELTPGVYGFTTEPGTAVILQETDDGNFVVATGAP